MKNEKISVIVPVYKVEPYLRKCLDSIINQTYRNLEIILVDDGSPDNCGRICDEYAERDNRIQVIHQMNEGLSSARNAGLEQSNGTYIGFVDSDDWIDPNFFECLFRCLSTAETDIAQCMISVEKNNHSQQIGYDQKIRMNREEALKELLIEKRTTNNVWNKLFHRKLFENLRFPKGRVYEDIAVIYQLFDKSNGLAVCTNTQYHYILRNEGIVSASRLENRMDYWTAACERCAYLLPKYPQFQELLTVAMTGAVMEIWSAAWKERRALDSEKMRELSIFAKTNYKTALRLGNYGLSGKLRICLTPYPKRSAYFLAALLRRMSLIKIRA